MPTSTGRRAVLTRTEWTGGFASLNREDLAWAGGLFEGEGCIAQARRGGRCYPHIQLRMTDLDVVRRFADVVKVGRVSAQPEKKAEAHHKPSWVWQADGIEAAQAVVAMLWPWLGARRRAVAASVLSEARASVS